MTLSQKVIKVREQAQLRIVNRDPWLSTCPSSDGKRAYIQEWNEEEQDWTCDCPAPAYVQCWHLVKVQEALSKEVQLVK